MKKILIILLFFVSCKSKIDKEILLDYLDIYNCSIINNQIFLNQEEKRILNYTGVFKQIFDPYLNFSNDINIIINNLNLIKSDILNKSNCDLNCLEKLKKYNYEISKGDLNKLSESIKKIELLLENKENLHILKSNIQEIGTKNWSNIDALNNKSSNSLEIYVILTDLEANFFILKKNYLMFLYSKIADDSELFKFNNIDFFIVTDKKEYTINDELNAEIYLVAYDSTANYDVFVDNQKLKYSNGKALFSKKIKNEIGKQEIKGVLYKWNYILNEKVEYNFKIEYEVAK